MSSLQPKITKTFTCFADWCLHKDRLSKGAKHTIDVLLKIAGTSDCEEADRILSNCTVLHHRSDKKITDISILSNLTNLTYLNLDNNQITDVRGLFNLTNLTYLNLAGNQITDISGLSTLTNLTDLCIDNNQITDISGLSTLTNLTYLNLSNNQITDISGLSSLTNLTQLYLDNNQITDISGLSTLTNLTILYLDNNQITDISGLSTLINLTHLGLRNNPVIDLSPLRSLNNLNSAFVYDFYLPNKYFLPQHEWQAQWLLEEKNAEIRRLLIQKIGYARICQELQATELDSWREYTLLKIDSNVDVEPIYLLKMTCPSTGFIHVLRVPPNMTSAREAIRWVNWGIDPSEFSVES
ncbi:MULTISPECIES: leucine-rich repeat domain-containing protein [Aerosakkonema]|uniref:leucine-rich repeat domain-containing protein n=1 Tax=Aerosakkonema TaxID=1246629 RepID=UPI0035B7FE21